MHKQYHANYFEAIIQLRPKNQEILDFIKKDMAMRTDVFVSKVDEKKFGVDIFLSSQRYARSLARKLQQRFKGEMKLTYTLHTESRQTSRKLYRATVLFRSEQ